MSKFREGNDLNQFNHYRDQVMNAEYFESLFFPSFVQVERLYLFAAHYTPDTLSRWLEKLDFRQDVQKLENTINHVHLDDLIEDRERQYEIGSVLQQRWLKVLSKVFPNQQFEVGLTQVKDGWELHMWAVRNQAKIKANSKAA